MKEIDEYFAKLNEATKSLQVEKLGKIDNFSIDKIVLNPGGEQTIAIVSGIHGNEPAGPLGLLEFLSQNIRIPSHLRVIVIPLANPTGFANGTRENADSIDINRQFLQNLTAECKMIINGLRNENIEFLYTLHEDPDLRKFYLYYTHHKELSKGIRNLAGRYFEIVKAKELHNDIIQEGLIPLPHTVRGTIEDLFWLEYKVPYITTESPGKGNLLQRIEFNKEAVKYVIQNYR